MKTRKLISKVGRYLELSKEFEQCADDLFEDKPVAVGEVTISTDMVTNSYISANTVIYNPTGTILNVESKTRAEVILDKAKSEADRSDRYDEYKKLQTELSRYFEVIKEL